MRARVLCVQVESISPKSLYMWVVCARAHARMCVGRWVGVWRVGGGVAVHACEVVPVCESARVGVRATTHRARCRAFRLVGGASRHLRSEDPGEIDRVGENTTG